MMSFRARLLAGQVTTLGVTIASAVVAILALETTTRSADRVAAQLVSDVAVADELRLDGERLVATSRGYLLSGEESYKVRARGVDAQLDSALGRLSNAHPDAIAQLERDVRAYRDVVTRAETQRALTSDPRAVLDIFDRELQPTRIAFEHDLNGFVEHEQARYETARRRARLLAHGAQAALVATSVIAVALTIGLGVLFVRAMTRHFQRVEDATAAAKMVATAREELMTVVSHDLRTPLQSIMLNASMLGGCDAKRIEAIERAANAMQALIDDLLDTARIEHDEIALHREPFAVGPLLADAVGLSAHSAVQRGVTLTSRASPELVVEMDRQRVVQILSNLIGNALKFVPVGGQVTVSAVGDERAVRFTVADTGSGIATEQLPHIFDRYYRPEQADQSGLGLGLYICRRLVEAHHGNIGVESIVGVGTTFWFTLPAGPA